MKQDTPDNKRHWPKGAKLNEWLKNTIVQRTNGVSSEESLGKYETELLPTVRRRGISQVTTRRSRHDSDAHNNIPKLNISSKEDQL